MPARKGTSETEGKATELQHKGVKPADGATVEAEGIVSHLPSK